MRGAGVLAALSIVLLAGASATGPDAAPALALWSFADGAPGWTGSPDMHIARMDSPGMLSDPRLETEGYVRSPDIGDASQLLVHVNAVAPSGVGVAIDVEDREGATLLTVLVSRGELAYSDGDALRWTGRIVGTGWHSVRIALADGTYSFSFDGDDARVGALRPGGAPASLLATGELSLDDVWVFGAGDLQADGFAGTTRARGLAIQGSATFFPHGGGRGPGMVSLRDDASLSLPAPAGPHVAAVEARAPLQIAQRQMALLAGLDAEGAPVWAVAASSGLLRETQLELWTRDGPSMPLSVRLDGGYVPVHAHADPATGTLELEWDVGLTRTFHVAGLDTVARIAVGDLLGGGGIVHVDELVVASSPQ